ncbi:MAG: PhnD/SsuA/transferrin family substrate-binding protein [Myxococcota bacterium]
MLTGRGLFIHALAVLVAVLALFAPAVSGAQPPERVELAVLANRGDQWVHERFDATAQYLGEQIEGYEFEVVPMTLDNSAVMVESGRMEFVLTQPANYAMLETRYGLTRIVTMRNRTPAGAQARFGGVIFVRADREEIQTLDDLPGRSLMSIGPRGLGGYLMAKKVLLDHGIDPEQDMQLEFCGFPQDQVVRAVRDGEVDVGMVRTHILERMAEAGEIELRDYRVLAARTEGDFPYRLSTPLYPEWAFAVARSTDPRLAQQVAIALLNLPEGHPASVAARNLGWTVPLDYAAVHQLLRELREPPYEDIGRITVGDVLSQYWWVILGVASTTLLLLLGISYVVRLNRNLEQSNVKLAHEMVERERAELQLLASEKMASLGQLAAGVAHELSTPLGYVQSNEVELAHELEGLLELLAAYERLELPPQATADTTAELSRLRSEVVLDDLREDVLSILRDNAEGLERMKAIVADIKVFSHVSDVKWQQVELEALVQRAIGLVQRELPPQVAIVPRLRSDVPAVECLPSKLERVLLNLMFNARDAIATQGTILVGLRRADADHVEIEVADDGPGIDSDTLRRIFDPFFTTKEVGRGTGLGLAISLRIVEAHGGRIEANSLPGRGASFRVMLPIEQVC